MLENRTVYIRPLALLPEGSIRGKNADLARAALPGTEKTISVPLGRNGRPKDIFRYKDHDPRKLQAHLEKLTGLNLSHNDLNSDLFSKTLKPRIRRDSDNPKALGLKLDLNNPMDFIQYLIAVASRRVAVDPDQKGEAGKHFYIEDLGYEQEVKVSNMVIKDAVLTKLLANRDNASWIRAFIKVLSSYSRVFNMSAKMDVLAAYTELREHCDNIKTARVMKEVLELPEGDFNNYRYLYDGLDSHVITLSGGSYKISATDEVIGYTEAEAAAYLGQDSAKGLKIAITKKLKE